MLLPEINGSSTEIGRNSALCFSRRGLATPLPASLAEAGWGQESARGKDRLEPAAPGEEEHHHHQEFAFVNSVKLLPLRGAEEQGMLASSSAAFSLHLQIAVGTRSPGHRNGSRQMAPATPKLLPELPRRA